MSLEYEPSLELLLNTAKQLFTLNPQPSTLNPGPYTLNPKSSTLNPQTEVMTFDSLSIAPLRAVCWDETAHVTPKPCGLGRIGWES